MSPRQAELPRPDHVDLQRFMGDWYVIGFIPLWPERHAHNGVETYRLMEDGRIDTVYRFRNKSFDAPLKRFNPVATVVPGSGNALWKMQFLWPFKSDYRIAYVAPDYSVSIIAREQRDYVWLMARSPDMPEEQYQELLQRIADMGYSLEAFKRHPQRWPEATPRAPLAD